MKSITKNINHYLPLFGILAAGLIGFAVFSSDKKFQLVLLVAVCAGYVTWGFVHHLAHKDLSLSILLEYFAVAVLGFVLVFTLLIRS
jgi:hypothetical protein